MREDTASLVADNAQTHFECRDEDDGVRCFSSPSRLTTNSTAELYFAAVRVAKSYRLVERASLRIAGERATCIELIGQRDAKRLSVLGDRLQLCFASDGALLLSDRWSAQSHDRQTAQRVQRGFNVPSYTKLLERFRPRIASGGQKG